MPNPPPSPVVVVALAAALLACRPARAPEADARGAVDSLVVERSPCYGTCPAYRVRLGRAGDVRYEPRQPGRGPAGDTTPVVTRVAPETLGALLAAADGAGVFDAVDSAGAPWPCAATASDAPTVTVSRFGPDGVRRVVDYHGCVPGGGAERRAARLRAWEERVDSLLGARRWARPARTP